MGRGAGSQTGSDATAVQQPLRAGSLISYEQAGGTIEEIAELLRQHPSRLIADLAGMKILGAAVLTGSRFDDGRDHRIASACCDVLRERDESWRYQRAYNSCLRSQGYSVDEESRRDAEAPASWVDTACREAERRALPLLGAPVWHRLRAEVSGDEETFVICREVRSLSGLFRKLQISRVDGGEISYQLDGTQLV